MNDQTKIELKNCPLDGGEIIDATADKSYQDIYHSISGKYLFKFGCKKCSMIFEVAADTHHEAVNKFNTRPQSEPAVYEEEMEIKNFVEKRISELKFKKGRLFSREVEEINRLSAKISAFEEIKHALDSVRGGE